MYSNPIQSLPWNKHTQKGDCPCIYCLKLTGLFYKEMCEASKAVTENKTDAKPLRDEEDYLHTRFLKENLSHQQLLIEHIFYNLL